MYTVEIQVVSLRKKKKIPFYLVLFYVNINNNYVIITYTTFKQSTAFPLNWLLTIPDYFKSTLYIYIDYYLHLDYTVNSCKKCLSHSSENRKYWRKKKKKILRILNSLLYDKVPISVFLIFFAWILDELFDTTCIRRIMFIWF